MKLSKWCEKIGIHYNTGYRLFKQNKIPNAYQLESGTIIIEEEKQKYNNNGIVIYCRVNNNDRKVQLEYQVERCLEFCRARGYEVQKIHKEIASGMNDSRRELWRMLDKNPQIIVVEHKDRLTRFGFVYLEKLLEKLGCKVVIIDQDTENETDMVKDFVSIITSFCCRLYGLRRGQNKAKQMKEIVNS